MDEEFHEFADIVKDNYLWSQITSALRPAEIDQVHRIIGADLIDSNQILLEELRSLVSILVDYRRSNEKLAHQQDSLKLLPGPPQRDILQVKVQSLLHKITQDGPLPEPKVPREWDILNFVMNPALQPSRPSSSPCSQSLPISRDELLTPKSSCPRSLRRTDSVSSAASVSLCKEKLNVLEIDEVLEELREGFQEEHQFLLANCNYIRHCLDEEMEFNAKASNFKVPTVQELTDLVAKLEMEEKRREHEQMISSLPDVSRRSGPASLASSGAFSIHSWEGHDAISPQASPKRLQSTLKLTSPQLMASDIIAPPLRGLHLEAGRLHGSPLRSHCCSKTPPSSSPLILSQKSMFAADQLVMHQPLKLKKCKTPPMLSVAPPFGPLPASRKSTPPDNMKFSATGSR